MIRFALRRAPLLRPRRLFLSALLALVLAGGAGATSYPSLEPAAMLEQADIVVLADVQRVTTELRDGRPWTIVQFAIAENLRFPRRADGSDVGDAGTTFDLAFLGGESGGIRLTVDQMPSFDVGDSVLLFAYEDEYASPIVGFRQGVWYVTGGVLRDADGRTLGADEDGQLVRGGDGSTPDDLLPILRELVGGDA